MKYCTRKESDGSRSGACCDIKDSKSPQCDDSLDGVYCSDNYGPDVDGADRIKYMVCPQDQDVCGAAKEFELFVPNLVNQVLQSDVSITKRSIPPGHVCHYKIHLDQQSSNFLDPDSIWMTQLLVKKPSGRKHIQNDKL